MWSALHDTRLHTHCQLRLAQSASDHVASVGNHFACTWEPPRAQSPFTTSRVLRLFLPTQLSERTSLGIQRLQELTGHRVVHDRVWHHVCFPLIDASCLGLVTVRFWVPLHGLRDALVRRRRARPWYERAIH